MPEYHPYKLQLSEGQVKKLHRGNTVRLGIEDLGQGKTYYLTAQQIRKIETARRKGKGVQIQMPDHQSKHNTMKGAGWFSNLWGKVKGFVKDNARKAVKTIAHEVIPDGYLRQGADWAIDQASDAVGLGKGMRRTIQTRRRGGSFKTVTPTTRSSGPSRRGGSFKLSTRSR